MGECVPTSVSSLIHFPRRLLLFVDAVVSVVCAEKANFELTNRVPLIIRAPAFAASAGKRTTVFYDHVDLYPTLAELAGLPSPQPAIGALQFVSSDVVAGLEWSEGGVW